MAAEEFVSRHTKNFGTFAGLGVVVVVTFLLTTVVVVATLGVVFFIVVEIGLMVVAALALGINDTR